MSDRPQGSVRTGTREEGTPEATAGSEKAPATGSTPAEPPVSSTQSIPTGQNRVVQGRTAPATGANRAATSAAAPATGTTTRPVEPKAEKAATKTPSVKTPAAKTPAAKTPAATAPATGTSKVAAATAPATGTSKVAAATGAARKPAVKAGRGPRRARLQLRHIDTWSAFKISFVLSIALFFIWMVAVGVLYGVLGGLGVFDTLNELFGQLSSSSGGDVITPGVVFGAAAVIGAVNIILLTALGTVSTFIYNLCSDLVGGLEVTLSERD